MPSAATAPAAAPAPWAPPATTATDASALPQSSATGKHGVSLLDVMAQQFVQREHEQAQHEEDEDMHLARKLQSAEQQDWQDSSMTGSMTDEDLAQQLQAEFDREAAQSNVPVSAAPVLADDGADTDFILALRLQADYDRAFNADLSARERRMNGNAKVSVSYEKHRRPVEEFMPVSESVDIDWSQEDASANRRPAKGQTKDLKGKEPALPAQPRGKKEIITKHDIPSNNKRNARRLETLSLSFNSGNTSDMPDLMISNRVFNEMREHSRRPQHGNARSKLKIYGKEDVATSDRVLDPRTRLMVRKATEREIECIVLVTERPEKP